MSTAEEAVVLLQWQCLRPGYRQSLSVWRPDLMGTWALRPRAYGARACKPRGLAEWFPLGCSDAWRRTGDRAMIARSRDARVSQTADLTLTP